MTSTFLSPEEVRELTGYKSKAAQKRWLKARRTTVVMLAEAGCEVPEIAAITGHKMQTCSQILDEVYMPKTAKMATNAINKLEGLKVVNVETNEPKAQKPLKQKGAKNG